MVLNRWDDKEAKKFVADAGSDPADRELTLRVYTSRIIGQDTDLVLPGGGNTSCKLTRKDIFGSEMNANATDILPMLRGVIGEANAKYFADRNHAMPVMAYAQPGKCCRVFCPR